MGINFSSLVIETDRTCILVGTWVSMMTWGVLAMQLLSYIRTWKRDSPFLRTAILLLFSAETTITIMMSIGVHHQLLVVLPGSLEFYTIPPVYTCFGFVHILVVAGVNWFYVWRYFMLSKNRWVAGFMFLCTLASAGLFFRATAVGLNTASSAMKNPGNVTNLMNVVAASLRVAYALEVFTLAATHTALLVELIIRLKDELLSAKQLVKRLILINVGSGGLTLLLCIATFVYSLRNVSANTLVFGSCLSRSYLMAMLFNLAMRDVIQDGAKGSSTGIIRTSTALGTGSYRFAEGPIQSAPFGKPEQSLDDDYELTEGKTQSAKGGLQHDIAFPPTTYSQA